MRTVRRPSDTIAKHDMEPSQETSFQIAVLTDSPDRMAGLEQMAAIEWLFCKQVGDSSLEFYRGETLLSSLDLQCAHFELSHLLGLVFVGSVEDFETFQCRWNVALPTIPIGLRRIPKWDGRALHCAATEYLARDLRIHRRQSGRASLELATFRKEFNRLQRSFAHLEEYVGRRMYEPATEIFEYLPDAEASIKGPHQRQLVGGIDPGLAGPLVQSLPVDSLGLSMFSLYVSARPEADAERLRIRLRAIETDQTFGEWLLGAADENPGWVNFALNHAIDEPALSLDVEVEWPAQSQHEKGAWTLALGAPHPYQDFCVRKEAGEAFGAPLAMRLFSSLPGVRVAVATTSVRPVDALRSMTAFIPHDVYGSAVQVLPALVDNKPKLVFYDREIGCLTVHPRTGGLAVARMDVIVPRNAWAVTAQIHLAHERSSATGFGLMVCASADESRELARLNQLESPSPSFSGWKTLSPLETRSITVVLVASGEEQASIYLVTRQAPDLSPDFAWARFSKFEYHMLPESFLADSKTVLPAPSTSGPVLVGSSK